MKTFIYGNYDIVVEKIYKNGNDYFFYIGDVKIYIIKYKDDVKQLDNLLQLTNYLYSLNIYVNTFIKNKFGNIYTKKNDYNIILLRENEVNITTSLLDIEKFFYKKALLKSYNFIEEWTKEIDTIEKELIEYNQEYTIIQNSIDYFIGMAENAVELMNNYAVHIEENNDSIGHKLNYKLFENNSLNNPFLFIKVNKMYDISNYIKHQLLYNKIDYDEIKTIINRNSDYEQALLFSCVLYPSPYFDLVKKVLIKEEKEEKINLFIEKIDEYNKLLSFLKQCINNDNIKKIIWIK